LKEYVDFYERINISTHLSDTDKEIWASISFFTDIILKLTPYINANLSDFSEKTDSVNKSDDADFPVYENTFIGYQDYITYLTYPASLKGTIFEILKWKHNEYFYTEKRFYDRADNESINLPKDSIIKVVNGQVINAPIDSIPEIIDVLLQFRHALTVPIIKVESAIKAIKDITVDSSNGVDGLLEGF
jgi:hypothetical protein